MADQLAPSNADLGELLWGAAREEADHRCTALQRASRAARFWSEEAAELVAWTRDVEAVA